MRALQLATAAFLLASPRLAAQRPPGADEGGPVRLIAGYSIFWINPVDFGRRPGSAFLLRGFWRLSPAVDVGLSAHFWGRRLIPPFTSPLGSLGVSEEDVTSYLGTLQLRPEATRRLALRGGVGLSRFVQEQPSGGLLLSRTTNPATLLAGVSYEISLVRRVALASSLDALRLLRATEVSDLRWGLIAGLAFTVH